MSSTFMSFTDRPRSRQALCGHRHEPPNRNGSTRDGDYSRLPLISHRHTRKGSNEVQRNAVYNDGSNSPASTASTRCVGENRPLSAFRSAGNFLRIRAPALVFHDVPLRACARNAADGSTALWIATDDGTIAMEASAAFKPGAELDRLAAVADGPIGVDQGRSTLAQRALPRAFQCSGCGPVSADSRSRCSRYPRSACTVDGCSGTKRDFLNLLW
jgi:hypothetical protein